MPVCAPSTSAWGGRLCLWAILAVAAALRLWRLDVPSLWFDEILVAMVAKLPVEAIFERVAGSDIHPPWFHLLTKLSMHAGQGDAALRLPQAVAGLAGVWLCWRVGRELVSEHAGLCMAAVCAVLPWQVLLSRQLRPYALVIFFCTLAFSALARTVRGGPVRDAACAALALWAPLLLYYGSLLAAGGAGCVLLCAWAARRTGWKHVMVFGLLAAIPVGVNLPFMLASLGHEQGITGGADRLSLALLCMRKLGDLLFREPLPWARAGMASLALLGAVVLLCRDRPLFLVSLGWVGFPLAALVGVGYGAYFNPWHLVFLMPVAVLWLGTAISLLPWRVVPAAVCVAAAVAYVTMGQRFYYEGDSHNGHYKQQARALTRDHLSGAVFVYPESGLSSPLNWYLDQFAFPNPLRAQRLGPQDSTVRMAAPGTLQPERVIGRTPVIPMAGPPFRHRVTASPSDFLSQVHSMEAVACQPVLEDILIATQAGRTGFAEFVFETPLHAVAQGECVHLIIHFGYSNRLPGNRFAVLCRFDDEPWAAAFESQGPDQRGHEKLEFAREAPFSRLTVRFELLRDGRSPAYTGEDLEAVRFLDFKIETQAKKK